MRQALSLGIDRQAIANRVLAGGEQPALNVVPPGVSGYASANSPDFFQWSLEERTQMARALLEKAGFTLDNPLRLTLRYPSGQGREVCVAVQAMWRKLPVQAILEQSEIKSLIADLRKGDFDLAYTGALDGDDPERFLDRLLADSSYNTGRYRDEDFERLMADAKKRRDPTSRSETLRQAEAVILRTLPVIPLYIGVSRALVSSKSKATLIIPPMFT